MEILVTYDVSTETSAGRRRLRRVAKVCEGYGQRVQKSVFECSLNEGQLEILRHRLVKEMKRGEDSIRIYRLREPHSRYVEVFGVSPVLDLREALVV
ncbi:MAG: CRISPR-associated endonuclease Cas2 [Dehalococcoidia bacterium]